jgi:hypothetical protein
MVMVLEMSYKPVQPTPDNDGQFVTNRSPTYTLRATCLPYSIGWDYLKVPALPPDGLGEALLGINRREQY